MDPLISTPTLSLTIRRTTYDYAPGGGRTFVRSLLRELRTAAPDLYSLAAKGHLVNQAGLILVANTADIAHLGSTAAAAVDDDALPTLTPTKERKADALDTAHQAYYKLAPALIDQANDRLAGIILSRVTSEPGQASLENLGSDGRLKC